MKKTQKLQRDRWLADLIAEHNRQAGRGIWNGGDVTPYFLNCRIQNPFRGVTSILTRDVGHHTSGWWKNPDYERCLHLSLSFFDPTTLQPRPQDQFITKTLIDGIFEQHQRWLWVEPAYSPDGKHKGVMHYRLFCSEGWEPIKPRGEVYDRELTEAGWHSYSDAMYEQKQSGHNPNAAL